MEAMLVIAEKEGINIRWWNFNPPIRGAYWAPPEVPPVIFLDHSLNHNTPLLRCVFAEELGHHFTLDRHCLCQPYFNYRDRLATSKAEYKALRWAAKYLMPKRQIYAAIKSGYQERWTLADYFNVTEEMVTYRIKLPDIQTITC
ncbi:ImmA/IrrE family metallo-endopeptidase [Syntrophomonas wolfei]|uniref:ImmA/IrrE family metallo-endopeptidase n=1 Tax=Syntrophomonas wolfei TaxID=863 RepID=UPI0023F560AD|nr:ImmA/IrrE family metallo-endopeptidase [Syntrophomonas wolfei]